MNTTPPLLPGVATASRPGHLLVRLFTCMLSAAIAGGAMAQNEEAGFASWAKVEGASETRDYKEKIRAGGGIDPKSRAFLEEIALPQLASEGNRSTIASLRKRMREFLLNDITDEKVGDEGNRIFTTFMEGLVAKDDEAAVVRVNAMLLIGELQTTGSAGRKPWPGATPTLAKAAANTALPKGVRIAAALGLARHVESAKGNAEAIGRMAKDVGGPLASILKEMAAADAGPENDWLASRCLSMLVMLGPATPETAAVLVKMLEDPRRSFDTRIRAATALAAVAGPQSKVDGVAVIRSIETISVASLQHDVDEAERLKLEKLFGGGALGAAGMSPPGMSSGGPGYVPPEAMGPPPGFGSPGDPSGSGGFSAQPPAEQWIPREVCRRAAWRLSSLANAILTVDGKAGLGLLAGGDAAAAKQVAENMRGAAMTLDANPVDASLLRALEDLKPPTVEPADGDEAATGTGDETAPGAGATPAPAAKAAAPATAPQ